MKVSIKDFNVQMDIKTAGIELEVYDNDDTHLGDLVITKTRLIWCHGRINPKNGVAVDWQEFIDYMEAQ